jgi:hypothetical protein
MVRHHHRLALAIALTLALIVAAPASAKFARGLPSARAHHSVPAIAAAAGVGARSDGFDWGDAGVGAGGALGLTVIVLGSLLAVTHTRRRAGHGPAQPTI